MTKKVNFNQAISEAMKRKRKTIPAPGKKFAKAKASDLSVKMWDSIRVLDRAELEALILTCEQFTDTNCGWIEYKCKQAIINLAKERLYEITPISQQL